MHIVGVQAAEGGEKEKGQGGGGGAPFLRAYV